MSWAVYFLFLTAILHGLFALSAIVSGAVVADGTFLAIVAPVPVSV